MQIGTYPESRGREEGILARRSQAVVLGCCNMVSLQGRTGGKRRSCPASYWVISIPEQQQSIHSMNLKIKQTPKSHTYIFVTGRN